MTSSPTPTATYVNVLKLSSCNVNCMHFNKKAGIEVQRMGSKTEHIENKDHNCEAYVYKFSHLYTIIALQFLTHHQISIKLYCNSLSHISIHETYFLNLYVAITACLNYFVYLYQRTPLHIAVKEGKGHTVKFLVEKGADVNIEDIDGVSEIIGDIADFVCFITMHLYIH